MNDATCDIGELLTAYLDGELRPGELEQVVGHLGDCPDCILEFHSLKEMRAAMRLLPVLKAPETLIPYGHYAIQLSSYLDGELPTTEYQSVFQHLQECTDCRTDLQELDAARTAVRSLPGLDPPEFLVTARGRSETPRFSRGARLAAAAAGIAAVAVLAVGVRTSSGAPPAAVDLDSFGDRHIARASVEPGFQMIPAVGPGGSGP